MKSRCCFDSFLASRGLDGAVSGAEVNTFIVPGANHLYFQVVKVS